ncbi:MAG: hypothetical protein IJB96_11000 [Lachnospira sp.]|nr:hypothetical protein [Lachnospira sp.]
MNQYAKTALSSDIEAADDKAQYDEHAKNLLSNKPILAWILKSTIKDFMDLSIKEIINLIEGEPQVGIVPVDPGLTNAPKITGLSAENNTQHEGKVTYDIRFFVYTPQKDWLIKLIINVEAQKKFNPSYDLTTRGVFYGARMLSAQYNTEFSHGDYDKLKKVYSIWVCMESDDDVSDTIISYRMTPYSIYGGYTGESSRYDLLEVIMICLGSKARKTKNRIIKLLDTILANNITVEDKKEVLQKEFDIEPTEKIEKELRLMCNLSDNIEEKSIEKGRAEGKAEELIQNVNNAAETIGLEKALELLKVSRERYEAAIELVSRTE